MIKRKSKVYLFAGTLLILTIIILLSVFYFNKPLILDEKDLIVELTVGEPASFDVNGSALIFGIIPPGSRGNRDLTLKNNYGAPVLAEFSISGNVSSLIVFNESVGLGFNETKTLKISTVSIQDEPYGNYSGIFTIEFYKA